MTDPWGIPAEQDITADKFPSNLTCWLLPSRKLRIYNQKLLLPLNSTGLPIIIAWSTISKANFRKSRKRAWTPIRPSGELSVTLNHFCDMRASADTVERPLVKACWLLLILNPACLVWAEVFQGLSPAVGELRSDENHCQYHSGDILWVLGWLMHAYAVQGTCIVPCLRTWCRVQLEPVPCRTALAAKLVFYQHQLPSWG